MTLILDTGPLVTAADRRDPRNHATTTFLSAVDERMVLPAPISAEVDYLLASRIGPIAQQRFLADLASGAFDVECLEPADYALIVEYNRRYAGLNLGLADLSVVALAYRYRTRRIVTFDGRHFRAIEPAQGGTFELLPA